MHALTVVHHHPRVLRRWERTTLVIPAHYSGYVRMLLWVWLSVWGIVEAALLLGLLASLRGTTPNPISSAAVLGALLALFTLAGAVIVWRLLWVTFGREVLEITPTLLTLRREPGYGKAFDFDRSMIRDLRVGAYSENMVYPSWGRLFVGKDDAFISFRYGGKTHRVARGLDPRDAEYVCELLRSAERA